MKVRALQTGYYGHKRRRPGDVFELQPVKLKDGSIYPVEKQFSEKWMEVYEPPSPKAKKASKKEVEEDSFQNEVI